MRIYQIGAAGGVGRPLAQRLSDEGHEVTGMHRDPRQADTIRQTGATAVLGDLITIDVAELTERMRGHSAVVFSAGAHGSGMDNTTAIDGRGLRKAVDAASLAGVSRFVLISVFPDAARGVTSSEAFEHYIRIKKGADVYLAKSDLDWVILRPGTLLDGPGAGRVNAGPAVDYGDVHRDDVAAFIAAALDEPALNRVIIELTTGDTPVVDAVARLTGRRNTS